MGHHTVKAVVINPHTGMPESRELHKGQHGVDCLCAWCGKTLCKNWKLIEDHFVGVQKGFCYCMKCAKNGKPAKDYPNMQEYMSEKDFAKLYRITEWKGARRADQP